MTSEQVDPHDPDDDVAGHLARMLGRTPSPDEVYARAAERKAYRSRWQTAVRDDPQVTGSLLGAALAVSTFGKPSGVDVFPSAALLAEVTGHGVSRCQGHLRRLHRDGWLYRHRAATHRRPAAWVLTIPADRGRRSRHAGPPMALDGAS